MKIDGKQNLTETKIKFCLFVKLKMVITNFRRMKTKKNLEKSNKLKLRKIQYKVSIISTLV